MCRLSDKDYNIKNSWIMYLMLSIFQLSTTRSYTMVKLPLFGTTINIVLLCLSTSLGVCSALVSNHDSDPKICDSNQVEQTVDSSRSSKQIGYRHVAYYVVSRTIPVTASASIALTDPLNYAIYARDHPPQDIPADKLTHLLYAFASVHPVTGETSLSDDWADTKKKFSTDSTNTTGDNLFGCLKQIYLLKKRNRNFKVLLSIGGASSSDAFPAPASTPEGRRRFARSAVAMLKDLPSMVLT